MKAKFSLKWCLERVAISPRADVSLRCRFSGFRGLLGQIIEIESPNSSGPDINPATQKHSHGATSASACTPRPGGAWTSTSRNSLNTVALITYRHQDFRIREPLQGHGCEIREQRVPETEIQPASSCPWEDVAFWEQCGERWREILSHTHTQKQTY